MIQNKYPKVFIDYRIQQKSYFRRKFHFHQHWLGLFPIVAYYMEWLPKASWAISWDMFDGPNKFLVSHPATAFSGMSLGYSTFICGADVRTMQHSCPMWPVGKGLARHRILSEGLKSLTALDIFDGRALNVHSILTQVAYPNTTYPYTNPGLPQHYLPLH